MSRSATAATMGRREVLLCVALLALAPLSLASAPGIISVGEGPLAPCYNTASKRIPQQYILKAYPDVALLPIIRAVAEIEGVSFLHHFHLNRYADELSISFHGFAFRGSDEVVAKVRNIEGVEFVEQDSYLKIMSTQHDPPSWGIDRVDQHELPLDKQFSVRCAHF